MNKTFSLSRFGHYFIYDFRRWAVNYGPTLLLMAAMPLIQYTLILVYSLIFSQTWETPGETTRIIIACITTNLLMLRPTPRASTGSSPTSAPVPRSS